MDVVMAAVDVVEMRGRKRRGNGAANRAAIGSEKIPTEEGPRQAARPPPPPKSSYGVTNVGVRGMKCKTIST